MDAEKDWIISLRRRLHRIPEDGFKEFKSQQVIMDTLDEIGIPYTTERTWVIGLIEGGHPGETVAANVFFPFSSRSVTSYWQTYIL